MLDPQSPCVVIADPGFDVTRLVGYILEPLARVRALLAGHVFVHSSAVAKDGQGWLFPAWGNTGKTNLMLQLLRGGSSIVSDDWSVILNSGHLAGYPRPVNLLNYNFDMFPELRQLVSRQRRCALWLDRRVRAVRLGPSGGGALMLRLREMAERMLEVLSNSRLPVEAAGPAERKAILLGAIVELHKVNDPVCQDAEPLAIGELARRATACFTFEHTRFFQRLAEFAYVSPSGGHLAQEIIRTYHLSLIRVLEALGPSRLFTLGIPERPDRTFLLGLTKSLGGLCPKAP